MENKHKQLEGQQLIKDLTKEYINFYQTILKGPGLKDPKDKNELSSFFSILCNVCIYNFQSLLLLS